MVSTSAAVRSVADRNVSRFIAFRLFFNSRFYYPVIAVMFLDYGLTMRQYAVLNFAWAAAIVLLEVPSGALADVVGRKRLVVFAAVLMVAEMLILCFAPLGQSLLLFVLFLINRVLSGAAEASASGADEALVYDALTAEGRAGEWSHVLERLMRWQSAGFMVSMIAGGAVYDPAFVGSVLHGIGIAWEPDAAIVMRFPAILTLGMAIGALIASIGFVDTGSGSHRSARSAVAASFKSTWNAALWIAHSRLALLIILAAVCGDSVVRLFLTVASEYYRLIDLPEFTYGLIGAAMASLGFIVPVFARRLVSRLGISANFLVVAALALGGLTGVAFQWRWWGVMFAAPLGIAMMLLNFLLSHYLNALAPSALRATILSFKGLAMNVAFGAVSLLFALLLRLAADGSGNAFSRALPALPFYFLATFVAVGLLAWLWKPAVRQEMRTRL